MPGREPRLAACKVYALPTALSLWPWIQLLTFAPLIPCAELVYSLLTCKTVVGFGFLFLCVGEFR